MKLLILRSYDLILGVYDRFSKISHFAVTKKEIIVEGLAKFFINNI